MKCPICDSDKSTNLLTLDCGNLDGSDLYKTVKIKVCKNCGHVYNKLSIFEIYGLMRYYDEEYASFNLNSVDKTGDRPGSDSPHAFKRYNQLFNLISNHIEEDSKILDIGCATGGFLDFLNKKGFKDLYGIDVIQKYVDYANDNYDYDIKYGNVYTIPFEDNSFDMIILDQVMEHLVDVKKAIREVKRVLMKDGLVCIGVPDASKYNETNFFDFYWFLLREHIQHFDLEHLKLLFGPEGFTLIRFSRSETPMMSEKMILPNLNVLFYLNDRKRYFKLKNETNQYIYNQFDKLKQSRKIINNLIMSQKPVYVWGIGREFLYFYEAVGLKNCNIIGLIDDTPLKQDKFTIDGKKIINNFILKDANEDSVLIITATAHTELIKHKVLKIGYRGKIIDV